VGIPAAANAPSVDVPALLTLVRERGRFNGATAEANGKVSGITCHVCGKDKVDVSPLGVGCFVCDAEIGREAFVHAFLDEYGDDWTQLPVLTLQEYAAAKFPGLDPALIAPWVKQTDEGIIFPYFDENGVLAYNRVRSSIAKPPKSPKGHHHMLYGLWNLAAWRAAETKTLYIAEGETATITCWVHALQTLGTIGANGLDVERDTEHLTGFENIVLMADNDDAGRALARTLQESVFASRTKVVIFPDGIKDANDLYQFDTASFPVDMSKLIADAVPLDKFMRFDPLRFFTAARNREPKFVPKLMADELRGDHEFAIGSDGGVLRYEEGVWKQDGDNWIESEAAARLGALYEPARVYSSVQIFKHLGSFNRVSFDPPVEPGMLVHCKSGIIDPVAAMRQGVGYVPTPATPQNSWLASVPWEYDPTATCPEITTFLTSVLPNIDVLQCFLEALGYGMTFRQALRRALFFYGGGDNGKSLTARMMGKLYGADNVTAMSLSKITGNKFMAAELVGKLANICADIGATLPRDAGEVFKAITGADPIPGERKYRDSFTFESGALQVYSGNQFPRTHDTTSAFFGRWIVFHFKEKFAKSEAEANRISALFEDEDEMRGLFRLAIMHLAQLAARDDFKVPAACIAAKELFEKSTSPFHSFIGDRCELGAEYTLKAGFAWSAFETYCYTNGFARTREEGRNSFYEMLASLDGITRDGDHFTGLRLSEEEQSADGI